jgi:hypothetical protein
MRRVLSASHRKPLFLSRWLAGIIGTAVALGVLFRLHASTGLTWPLVGLGVVIVFGVSILIGMDVRLRRSLKQVAVDDRFLYVTEHSGSAEAAIPLDEIVRVTQRRGKQLRPVSVYLRSPSVFGTRIRFLPPLEWGFAWKEDRIVNELRALAKRQERRDPDGSTE